MATTSKIPFVNTIEVQRNAGFHNSIFRGKYLGTLFTEAQSAVIQAGTFDDLFVGDYWTINEVNWRIADFDTYYQCGDTALNTHHIIVIPDKSLYNTQWNTTNDTSSGYRGSAIRANIKASNDTAAGAEAKVITAFGSDHVLSYRSTYPTSHDADGIAESWDWTDTRVELMNEIEVYGTLVWSIPSKGREVGINKRQLSLFRLSPQFINIRKNWWLRSVMNGTTVACVSQTGSGALNTASTSIGVRPFALIS